LSSTILYFSIVEFSNGEMETELLLSFMTIGHSIAKFFGEFKNFFDWFAFKFPG
jgi:hypothetical protein